MQDVSLDASVQNYQRHTNGLYDPFDLNALPEPLIEHDVKYDLGNLMPTVSIHDPNEIKAAMKAETEEKGMPLLSPQKRQDQKIPEELLKTNWQDLDIAQTQLQVDTTHDIQELKHDTLEFLEPDIIEPITPSAEKLNSIPKLYIPPLQEIREESPRQGSLSQSLFTAVIVEKPVCIQAGWFGSSSYYCYTINTIIDSNKYSVTRRFSDLEWLHNQLSISYKGLIIPPLPEKKMIGKDEKFLEERRAQMEKYLNLIASNLELRQSPFFKLFTTCPNDRYQSEQKKIENPQSWLQFSSLEEAMDSILANIESRYQFIVNNKIAPFSREMSEIEAKLNRIEAPTQSLTGQFTQWVQSQFDRFKSISQIYFPEYSDFNQLLGRFRCISEPSSENLSRLNMEVKEELYRVEGLRSAVNSYKETVNDYSRHETLINRQLQKHKSSTNEDIAAKYLNDIQRTQDSIDKIAGSLQDIEKNIRNENNRFNSTRDEHFQWALKEIINSQVALSLRSVDFWKEARLSLSPE